MTRQRKRAACRPDDPSERFTILDMGLTQESARELVKMLYRE